MFEAQPQEAPDQDIENHKQLKINGHIPGPHGHRRLVYQALNQQGMREPLLKGGRLRQPVLVDPGSQACHDQGHHQNGQQIRRHQTCIALTDVANDRRRLRPQQCKRRQITGHHQEHLGRITPVVVEQLKQAGPEGLQGLTQGSIRHQVMQHDQMRGQDAQPIHQMGALSHDFQLGVLLSRKA